MHQRSAEPQHCIGVIDWVLTNGAEIIGCMLDNSALSFNHATYPLDESKTQDDILSDSNGYRHY